MLEIIKINWAIKWGWYGYDKGKWAVDKALKIACKLGMIPTAAYIISNSYS